MDWERKAGISGIHHHKQPPTLIVPGGTDPETALSKKGNLLCIYCNLDGPIH